jgi:hypothetical protein
MGDAFHTGVFSPCQRSIHLWRARRATNRDEDVCFVVQYASANGWYKSNKKYLHATP